jgi:hypothetical protein
MRAPPRTRGGALVVSGPHPHPGSCVTGVPELVGVEPQTTVAEHTLGEDRGFVVTASIQEQQVCLTATPTGAGGGTTGTATVTECGVPGSDHRAFAAASGPSGLSEVQLADAEGEVISVKPIRR